MFLIYNMNKKENIIECKDLNVSFYIQGHGMGSFKEFLLSLGTKKPFVRKQVLFDINLQIKRGECFGILDFLDIKYDGLSWEAFSNSKTWVVKLNFSSFQIALERI